jgi:GNAT superfamily N-acetyltransferase
MNFNVAPSTINDLDFVCYLFREAIAYQERKGYPIYRTEDREVHAADISAERHFKVVKEDVIAGMFSIHYSDPVIWGKRDAVGGLYLHRIVVNPVFKGRRLFQFVMDWAIERCKVEGIPFLRMDTWDHNPDLVDYYETFGFNVMDQVKIPMDSSVSINCQGNEVVLMEYSI